MKKLFLLLAFLLAWSGSVYATDVTITASQIASFNPSGIGSDRTITVGVTNNSLSVTSSAAFPSAIVGLGGFQVNIGGTQYIVSSVTSTSLMTLTTVYAGSTGSASMVLYKYVLLQIYADRAFQPAGETYVVQPGAPGSGAWYKRVAASIINDGATNTLWIPSLVLDSTTDAITTTNQARYFAGFYRPDGSLVQAYSCFTSFQLRPDTPTTWTAICAYNAPSGIVPPNRDAYSKTEIDARFPSCTAGQMLYYAVSGNAQACLTVGSGLSISSGTITSSGGGGGVSSVAMSVPSFLSVAGSPITTSGTLAVTLATQTANTVFAGPTSGGAATPTFRALVAADIASLANDLIHVQNVKDGYSCAGDGVTNDNTCLANAISAANSSTTKKIVYLPEGSYLITTGLTVPTGVTIRGAGANSIITTASTIDVITVSGNNVNLENFKVNGGRRGIVVASAVTNVRAQWLTFTGITAHTASTPTASFYTAGQNADIWIEDSIFSANGNLSATDDGADIFIASSTGSSRIHANRNKITGGFSRFSVVCFDCNDSEFVQNYIDQNNQIAASTPSDISGYGIVVYSSVNTGVIKRNKISENIITNAAGSGIYLVNAFETTVTNNTLEDTAKQQLDSSLPVGAISLNGGDNSTVVGNVIETTTTGNGIALTGNYSTTTLNGGINSAVTSMVFASTLLFGSVGDKTTFQIDSERIYCLIGSTTALSSCVRGAYGTTAASHSNGATVTAAGPANITVIGNTIRQVAGNAGINIRNTCNGCVIDGNGISNGTTGVLVTTGIVLRDARITNNTIDQITGQGINLVDADDVTVGFNRVIQTSAQGILIQAGDRNIVVGNNVSQASAGLDMRATRTIVYNNEIFGNTTGITDSGVSNVYDGNKVYSNTTDSSFGATPTSQELTLTTGTTPDISEAKNFILLYGSTTTITNLTGGSILDPIKILRAGNGNVTIQGGGSFNLHGGYNFAMATGDVLVLRYSSGWYEVARQTSTNPIKASRAIIGTDTFGQPLEVVSASGAGGNKLGIISNTTATGYSGWRVYEAAGSKSAGSEYTNASYSGSYLTNGPSGESFNVYTSGNVPIVIGTNNTKRMQISGAGVVNWTFGSDATGDTYYRDGSGNLVRLAIGTAAQCLVVSGGLPAWGSCSAGSGITGTIAANQVAYGTGVDTIGGVAGFTFDGTSVLTLGVAGTSVGSVAFKNATSGTITVSPVTGALGTVTLSLPAATDTLVGKATTDTFTNKTLAASSNVLGGVTMTLGSDADGDTYYRSSNVLTRLAKGTAGQCYMMNGGATAPTWGACDGTITWDVIANPIANQTLSMTTFTTTHNYTTGLLAYNWTGNTSTSSAFTLTHNNTSATGYVLDVGATSASSLVKPLVVRAKNAVVLNTDVFGDFTFQPVAQTSGSPTLFTITGPAHTGATAGTEVNDVNINLNRTVTFAAGALSENRSVRFQAPTLAAASASTISDAINVDINSPTAGTNATITRSTALRVKPSSAAHHGIWADGTVSYTGDAFAAGLSGTKIVRLVGSNGTLNVVLQANGALATNATDGFTYLPSSAGTPTGTPTSYTGAVPVEVDTTNSRFYGYFGGAWVNLTGSGGGTPGGSNTQVQYNNASAFGGISGFTSDGTNVTAGSGNLRATRPRFTTSIDDANGNESIALTATGSAVNEFTITNAATGGNPQLSATGGDTDVGIDFLVKAAGVYRFLATTSGPADVRLFEDADNGTNYASLIAPASMAANRVLTLPDATDTLAGKATTDTFTNKTLTASSNVLGGVTMTLGSDADGDIYARASGVLSRVGIGSTGDVLTVSGGAPIWAPPAVTEWDIIANPLGNQTLSMSTFTTTHNYTTGLLAYAWSGNTSTSDVFTISQSNTTATGDLVQLTTSASVSVKPLRVTPRGNDSFLADHLGNVVHGNAALSTSATDGFFYLTTAAGTPSGTPATTYTGRAPLLVDTTNSRLYGYFGGAWVNLSAGAGGSPGGSSGDIQYNNGGSFGGSVIAQSSTGRITVTPTALSSGTTSYHRIITPADTGITADTESIGMQFGGNTSAATVTRTLADGTTIATQRETIFVAPTYAAAGATTLTASATVAITNAPQTGSNITQSAPYAFWVQAGNSNFDGLVKIKTSTTGAFTNAGTTAGSGDKLVLYESASYRVALGMASGSPGLYLQSTGNGATSGIGFVTGITTARTVGLWQALGDLSVSYAASGTGGSAIGSTTTGSTALGVATDDAVSSGVTDVLTLTHLLGGSTASAGLGTGILLRGVSSTTNGQDQARIASLWTTATHASRTAAIAFSTVDNAGSLVEHFRVAGNSSANGAAATLTGVNGSSDIRGQITENLTLSTSGTTTDTTMDLPANSIILSVTGRITTTITTATDWKLGDATIADRFSDANATMTANTTTVGINQWKADRTTAGQGAFQQSTAKVRVTTTGTPGAGAIRITIHYIQLTAPTS